MSTDRHQKTMTVSSAFGRNVRIATGIQLFVLAAATGYWALWFGGGRDVIANQQTAAYFAFQNACLWPDCWMALACALGARALLTARPSALLWTLLASSSSIFLGLMDCAFNVENGVYRDSRGAALALELTLNALALGCGAWGIRFAWRYRSALLAWGDARSTDGSLGTAPVSRTSL